MPIPSAPKLLFRPTGLLLLTICALVVGSLPSAQKSLAKPVDEFVVKKSDRLSLTTPKGITPQFDSATDFSEGLALVQIENGYRYIDPQGHTSIQPDFEATALAPFSNGFAIAQIGTRYSCLNRQGKLLTHIQFDGISRFSEDLAAVRAGR